MKRTLSYLTVAITMLAFTPSCKKSSTTTPGNTTQTINATLKNTATYEFDLGYFGEEEGASISRQAVNSLSSSIQRTESHL